MKSIRFHRKRPEGTRPEVTRPEVTRPGVTKSAFSAKDWVSLTLSMLAFGLSVATAYYNIWRQEDNVGVVAHLPPYAVRTAKDRLSVERDAETQLAFLNSGNRPVAIMAVVLSYVQSRLKDDEECPFDSATRLATDFKPLVVKPNEVVTALVKFGDAVWYDNSNIKREGSNRLSWPVLDDNREKARFPMEICLEVMLSTPSIFGLVRRPSIFKYWAEPEGGWSWSFDGEGPVAGKPLVLVKESWSLLSK
jgi:hypothetical protein